VYVFAYSFFLASRPLSDGDFWWHLKTGQFIVQNHSIPHNDFFSFTNFGKSWVTHEWLSEVIFYLIYSRFGFNALIFIFAILTATAFWLVFKRCESHAFIAGFATFIGVWSTLPTIGVRPRVFTLLFASVFLFVLSRYARRGEGRGIWLLVPLMVLWVNLHAGYIMGFVLIGVTIVGVLLDGWSEGETLKNQWSRLKNLALLLGVCLVSVNLNPHGPRIYLFPFEFFFSPVQQEYVIDWLSPNFHDPAALPLAMLILLTIAAIAISPKRIKLSELLLFICTLYATLKSNRHMAIFALVAAPLLATYFQHWVDSTLLAKSFGSSRPPTTGPRAIFFAVLLLIPILALVVRLKTQIYSPPKQDRVGVPLLAVEFMKDNQVVGNTFTDPNIWSGYLIWTMPSNPVYIDGRIDMYGDSFVKNYVDITHGLADWREPFTQYSVKNVILSPDSALRLQLQNSPEWEKVYQDEMALVFKRR
jgi:hypothetical protein